MKTKQILLSGALFYVFIAPFFFHPDLKIIYSLASLFPSGVLNVYNSYTLNPGSFPLGPFVYPPAAYFITGIFTLFARLVGGLGFDSWLWMGNTAVEVDGIFRYIFAIKLPFILLHLLSGYFITKIVPDNKKNLVALLWFFNPISIYVVAMMGQIDGLAVIWIILALIFAKKYPNLGAISLGIGAAVKSFPLLLLPVYVILVAKSWKQKLVVTLAGMGSYLLWVGGFLGTKGFYEQALTSNLSKSILSAGTPLVICLVFLIALLKHNGKTEKLNNYFLLIAMIVLSGIHFHPQWAMWAIPMAVIYLSQYKKWWWGLAFFLGWIINLVSFSDKFLTVGLLSPIDFSVFFLPSLTVPHLFGTILMIICTASVAYETFSN
jgi:hypothetical protein